MNIRNLLAGAALVAAIVAPTLGEAQIIIAAAPSSSVDAAMSSPYATTVLTTASWSYATISSTMAARSSFTTTNPARSGGPGTPRALRPAYLSDMKISTLLAVIVAVVAPTLGSAQAHLPNLKDKLKVHQERLPRPSHRLYNLHGRRLAVKQSDGTHQPRLLGKKDRHNTRKSIRGVTHHITAPHKHVGPHKP